MTENKVGTQIILLKLKLTSDGHAPVMLYGGVVPSFEIEKQILVTILEERDVPDRIDKNKIWEKKGLRAMSNNNQIFTLNWGGCSEQEELKQEWYMRDTDLKIIDDIPFVEAIEAYNEKGRHLLDATKLAKKYTRLYEIGYCKIHDNIFALNPDTEPLCPDCISNVFRT